MPIHRSIAMLFVVLFALFFPGCMITPAGSLQGIEDLDDGAYLELRSDVTLVTRVLAARAVRDQAVAPERLVACAAALELALGSPLWSGGPNPISDQLKAHGFSDDEVLQVLLLSERVLRSFVALPGTGELVGPRTRDLAAAIALELRHAGAAPAPAGDAARADELLGKS